MTQGIDKQIGTLPAIEPELHLFQVRWKMLGANSVPRSHDSAFEKRKGRFDGIGVNVAHDVHAGTVINLFVVRSLGFPHSRFVSRSVIGENDLHVLGDILADVLCERSAFCISRMEKTEIAIALADADDHFLVVKFSDLASAPIPSADIGNVHLDFAVQHGLVGLCHCVPDAMAEIPRRLVAHSHGALDLQCGHALLRFAEKMRGQKPLHQWQMRIVKHGAGCNGELIVTIFAVEELFFGFQFDHGHLAAQAAWAFREAQANEQGAALLFGRKQAVYIN